MPVHRSQDSKGPYYQWGTTGRKYYYISNNVKSRESARGNAYLQARAIYANGYRRK